MGFELVRTASRVVLTFFPLLVFKNMRSRKWIKYAAIHGIPTSEENKEKHINGIKRRTRALQILLSIPFLLFWSTIVASLEKTPLTGRSVNQKFIVIFQLGRSFSKHLDGV
jgi:hypothetical protein